jgi:Na+-translocating ferredoxin:NAD+ oxidoreductase subunit C
MKSSNTFRHGGIFVDTSSGWEQKGRVENAFLPNGAVILLKQHAGPQARCVVQRDEYVREGMVIGRADSPLSANVHSPIPGVVRDIRLVPLPEGGYSEAVVVDLEGTFDRLGRRAERYLWKSSGRNEILTTLRDKGVVDTELPGLPLFDLLGERRDIDLLVINAVECEPYIRAESCLLRDRASEVVEGTEILRKILAPKRTVIAACREVTLPPAEASDGLPPVETIILDPKYPQDMPSQLMDAIAGGPVGRMREATILRPSSAYAVYEAIVHAMPMVERYVSVGGGALKRPTVLKARIGTRIGDLIEECGGFRGPPARLVLRDAIRGHSVHDLDTPITKTSSAVIALDAEEVGSLRRMPCIRCGRCRVACPERLEPDTLFRLVERRMIERSVVMGLRSCTACGACSYVCPSRVPLAAAFASETRSTSAPSRESEEACV